MIDLQCPECAYISGSFPTRCSIVVNGNITMRSNRNGELRPALSRSVSIQNRPSYEGGEVTCPKCGYKDALENVVLVRCGVCGQRVDKEDHHLYYCEVRGRAKCDECFDRPMNLDYCGPCDYKPDCTPYERYLERRNES